MEYAEGGDLQTLLRKKKFELKRISEELIWGWANELTSAISALHVRSIMHRDIKALNILLTKDLHLKLGDLGASKICRDADKIKGSHVGTPLYLAPERVRNKPYDLKVDIWALGCVLYQLASFHSPFNGDNLVSLGNDIVRRNPKPLPSLYSERFRAFVNRLLTKEPNDRPNVI
jgi:NIMA (never in mitosis gene a)-related kinase